MGGSGASALELSSSEMSRSDSSDTSEEEKRGKRNPSEYWSSMEEVESLEEFLDASSNAPLTPAETAVLKRRLKTLNASGDYAIPTTDSGFKHLLAYEKGNETVIVSFLNTFIPVFYNDPVKQVFPASTVAPVLKRPGHKQTFMGMHVISERGVHYVIEMQAKRHVNFDERALFYACSTYAQQVPEEMFQEITGYKSLKRVLAIQVLDYDTNRVRGIQDPDLRDTLVKRVWDNPLPDGEFIKHFLLTCRISQQVIDHLQLVQVELGRVQTRDLYPPKKDFTDLEWWLSIFKSAGQYTQEQIQGLEEQGVHMPDFIKEAFERIRYSRWSPKDIREYKNDVVNRESNAILLAIERSEGREEGEKRKAIDVARKLLASNLEDDFIIDTTGLSVAELQALKRELRTET